MYERRANNCDTCIRIMELLGLIMEGCSLPYRNLYVSILAGQSNGAGRAQIVNLQGSNASLAQPFDGVIYANLERAYATGVTNFDQPAGDWRVKTAASNTLGQFGPDITISRSLASTAPSGFDPLQDKMVLLKFTSGGSGLVHWTGAHPHGIEFINWLTSRFIELSATASNVIADRLFIVQGESDSNASSEPLYVSRLNELVGKVENVSGPIRTIFAEIKSNRGVPTDTFAAKINAAVKAEGYTTVPTNDLTLRDSIHYDAQSQVTLGNRLVSA